MKVVTLVKESLNFRSQAPGAGMAQTVTIECVHHRLSVYAGAFVLFLALGLAQAQDSDNLFYNGGFEEAAPADVARNDALYKQLIDRGVLFPHEGEEMPKSVVINPNQMWADNTYIFEYLKDTAGGDVHSGTRAIKITSPRGDSGVMLGSLIRIANTGEREAGEIEVGKPCKYSFFAKGKGTLRAQFYLYESVQFPKNIYDYSRLLAVTPKNHKIEGSDWQEYTGTITVNGPEVGAVRFVLCFNGEVSIDDVKLTAE